MRITGPRVWGLPLDIGEAIRALKRLPKLGIDFIDTANSYGPEVSEQLIRETLYPYDGILITTKAGLRRPGPEEWERDGRPEHLREQAIQSRDRLGLEQFDLWQLHAIDPKVPRDEQFEAVKSLLDDKIIRHALGARAPQADIDGSPMGPARHTKATDSSMFSAATFSSRWATLEVPGMGLGASARAEQGRRPKHHRAADERRVARDRRTGAASSARLPERFAVGDNDRRR